MRFSAILFDLDGTLVDSIDLYGEAVRMAMGTLKIPVSKEKFFAWYTRGKHLAEWLQENGIDEALAPDVRRVRDLYYEDLLRARVEWLKGAKESLAFFKSHLPIALITGSWKSYVTAIDSRLDVSSHFPVMVTCEDMGKFMKPHPHGLLLAADRLGIDPKACIYVGDQLIDVQAAKNARMESCIVHGTYTLKEAVEEADIVVKTLEELTAIARV